MQYIVELLSHLTHHRSIFYCVPVRQTAHTLYIACVLCSATLSSPDAGLCIIWCCTELVLHSPYLVLITSSMLMSFHLVYTATFYFVLFTVQSNSILLHGLTDIISKILNIGHNFFLLFKKLLSCNYLCLPSFNPSPYKKEMCNTSLRSVQNTVAH